MDIRVKRVLKFIDENFQKNLKLKIITKYSRVLDVLVSVNFLKIKAYLKRRRVEKAEELLKDDSLSIKEISYKVGYK